MQDPNHLLSKYDFSDLTLFPWQEIPLISQDWANPPFATENSYIYIYKGYCREHSTFDTLGSKDISVYLTNFLKFSVIIVDQRNNPFPVRI